MNPKRKTKASQDSPKRRYFSVVPLGRLHPSDGWKAYQIETVVLRGDVVIERIMYDKPDTKQAVMAKLELMNDPDEQEYNEAIG